eukprot:gnl/MRDRNA2_/MRDRNA2_88508_c0_seq1.p1 gnl/MRDRNA2_/MRDRNA2_88508_c0~~gnl/MRDRNA2_/MRDRNA2_88508_c0_seq1.p1  ORF type:complete len:478 (-),score=124.56 gnl/MRDRNA2_/MRDRNA2_88508_c0_seq1:125-1558(-)
MQGLGAIILLSSVAHSYATVDTDRMFDMALDRALRGDHSSDMDDTTLAKNTALASSNKPVNMISVTPGQSRGRVQMPVMKSSTASRMPNQSPSNAFPISSTHTMQGRGQVQAKAAMQARHAVTAATPARGHPVVKATAPAGAPVVAVVGFSGGVGTCLIAAMERIGLKPFAKISSKGMELEGEDKKDLDWDYVNSKLLAAAKEKGGLPVMVDVTASGAVQELYEGWLKQGISVAAANKGIFAGDEAKYEALLSAAAAEPKAYLLHEATVGAGLPVISTIKDLVASSHEVQKIEGVMSGTLAFVLGEVAGGKKKFSEAVAEAKALGYTEPDPREDLNGMDVARKSVILARVAGLKGVDLSKMNVESLVPESLRDCSVDDFMAGLPKFDDEFAKKVADVEAKGERLHYAGAVDMKAGKVTVGPLGCAGDHPFNSAGPDNLVSITTNFYTRPLVVQGAGAGGDVTATGVLGDVLKVRAGP